MGWKKPVQLQFQFLQGLFLLCGLSVCYLVLSSGIADFSIYILDEAKNAECAREMFESGNLFKPTFNGQLRTDKPPLHYFFMMAGFKLFGINSLGARFFSSIFGILTLINIFLSTKKHLGKSAAFYTFLILIASIHFVLEFHLAVPDPYLIFFISLSLTSFYDYFISRKLIKIIFFYLAIGLGVLTKGPVAIIIPALVACIFLLINKKNIFSWIRKAYVFPGIILAAMICIPWYATSHIVTEGEWTRGFFLDHNINRFAGTMEGHGGGFWLIPLFIVIGFLPFSFFSYHAIKQSIQHPKNHFLVYCLVAIGVVCLLFSLSKTKLPNYVLPAYPFMAVVLASYLSRIKINDHWLILFVGIFNTLLNLAIPSFILLFQNELGIHYSVFKPIVIMYTVFPLVSLYIIIKIIKKNYNESLKALAFNWIIIGLIFFKGLIPEIDKNNPVAKSRSIVIQHHEIAYYKRINPAFMFNHQSIFHQLETLEELSQFIQNSNNPIIISESRYIPELNQTGFIEIFNENDLFENTRTVIYSKSQE